MYLAHRQERLEQISAALETLGPHATAREIVEVVYADVDRAVWWAAELSVRAQLVGASRETVNKALADFAHRGWIRLEGKSVLISDSERLARRAR